MLWIPWRPIHDECVLRRLSAEFENRRIEIGRGSGSECGGDGSEEGVGVGAGDVAHDVHEQPVPAGAEERLGRGAAQAAMAVAPEEDTEAGGRGEAAAAAAAVGAASGAPAHPPAVATGAAEAAVRLVCAHDVRVGE